MLNTYWYVLFFTYFQLLYFIYAFVIVLLLILIFVLFLWQKNLFTNLGAINSNTSHILFNVHIFIGIMLISCGYVVYIQDRTGAAAKLDRVCRSISLILNGY